MSTIKDVARACGLSAATVSYVINDGPRSVRPETRERVLQAIRELNYFPSAVARGLQGRRMNTLGVVLPREIASPLSNPYYAPVLDGIMNAAMRGKQSTTIFTGHLWSDAQYSLPVYCDGRCDGLLLLTPPTQCDILSALTRRGVPFVIIDDLRGEVEASSVEIDNVAGAYALIQHLLEQGHRRIAMFQGASSFRCVAQRTRGYREALAAWGIAYDETLVFPGEYSAESGYENARLLLQQPAWLRPTAIFGCNDLIALGVLCALREAGVRVPQEMSVVGFDDVAPAAISQPPLTTIHQPLHRLGETAIEMLLAQIEGEAAPGEHRLLPTELITRGSVAPPPNNA
ncbi:MAG TPA: LacI family DNA-binding transcriptional regulator [Chthonomonadaceae bacterium]|nr:LacI family DNA-binding transcriptional regulator [Chthonomonadaceae bacterium]